MKSSHFTPLLVAAFLGTGFLVGLLIKGKARASKESQILQATKSDTTLKTARRSQSSFQFLNEASESLRAAPEFSQEVKRLYSELKSPLRADSLLEYQVQEGSFDEWALLLKDGQVLDKGLIREVARRLVLEDVDRALKILRDREYRIKGRNESYAFRDSLLGTVAQTAPEKGLSYLKSLTRGGSQMDNSRYFSGQWAQADPQGAARHFEELVILRNMTMDGKTDLPRDRYANDLMKEWVKKDSEAAAQYLEDLPTSPTKSTLEKAFNSATK